MHTQLEELAARLDRAEARQQQAETRQHRAERRARTSGACALGALALTGLLNARPAAFAQSPGTTLASLVARIAALEAKTAPISLSSDPNAGGTNTLLTIRGVNVQIVNGLGGTETQNGLGNLIVGYNESDAGGRTGSHNIVTGIYNNYTSSGGILGGYGNALEGVEEFCVGEGSVATGHQSTVTGGAGNTASGDYASVSGGQNNTAYGQLSAISGGYQNTTGAVGATGLSNSGYLASIAGGQGQSVSAEFGFAPTVAGPQGPQGPAGTNGTNGKDGVQGPKGDQGPAGKDGQNGKNGTNGTNGKDGAPGSQGPQGPAGPGFTPDKIAILNAFSLSSDPYIGGANTLLTITGVNLQIVNGLGATETQNGLGNLVVGYNELRHDNTDNRLGSHNIVTGIFNNFASSGGLLGGYHNSLSDVEEFSIGANNTVAGHQSAISAGIGNSVNADYASVSGGENNFAGGRGASVSGGIANHANSQDGAVSGGFHNAADGVNATVTGGLFNAASGDNSSVSGGSGVVAASSYEPVTDSHGNITGARYVPSSTNPFTWVGAGLASH